ncbi:hypothetical protein HPB48_005251 [Haemaphysalis longicornis]|uniref:Transposable element P transposase-like GTP-binding insertion domain-containing protein n=1 Tax=Haemaphysalis longicornis TaxID=44386 RepID=A0A9J6FLY9_HAELO|nr:hypothetical protein HPB48_005251 [Haemaphysalis longicornis]
MHIEWDRQKMKVRLAVEALSASVADSLDFCEKVLKHPQFRGVATTAIFTRLFDHLFDILSSRNPLAKPYNAPLRAQNESCWRTFFVVVQAYISDLKDTTGRPDVEGAKKAGFLGFIIYMQNIKNIFELLVYMVL